jgi:predicted permease
MPDYREFVRRHVAPLALPPDREQKIVDEWAAQLEEIYDALRAGGRSDAEAWSEVQRQVADWPALSGELLDDEPALVRLALASSGAQAPPSLRRAITRLRETLTIGVMRDLRAGCRLLVKQPGFSAAVVLTLAVCLGANAAVFTVVHSVLLRPLPAPDSHRLVGIGDVYPTITPNDILSNDAPSYFDRRQAVSAFEEQGLFSFWFDTIAIDGVPHELRGMRVMPSVFRMLRVPPALGRTFVDAEGEVGNERHIVLSDALWRRLYGGDANVIGRTLRLGWTGRPYTIVGVMPRSFTFFDHGYPGHAGESQAVQYWIPLALTAEQKSDDARTRYGYFHVARLRDGATLEQARAQVEAVTAANVKRFPQFNFEELGMYTSVTPLHEALTRRVRRTLYLLWGGAGFVLLIGIINVANLSLARASARQRELATRLALGASRLQIARQLMIEALIPAALGGAAGIVVGTLILSALAVAGLQLPSAGDVAMNAATVAMVAAVSVLVGAIIGVAPAAATRAVRIRQVLADGSRTATFGRAARLFRRGLVAAQVALSVLLLIAATLLFASIRHLLALDAGFSAAGVLTATLFPPPSRYPDRQSSAALMNRILDKVRALPGVETAGITSNIALSGFESPSSVSAGEPSAPGIVTVIPSVVGVSPGYFEAMNTALVRGRYFSEQDRTTTLPVAIVDERLAGRLWPGEDPIGKSIFRGPSGPFTIVGVVREVRFEGLTGSIDAIGTAYFPHTQAPPLPRLRWIAIKSAVDHAAMVRGVRRILLEIDPDLPIADIRTMDQRTALSLTPQRLAADLAAMFAVIALFLSLLGIYGVLAHIVAHRSREIGIRLALGSSVRAVLRLVLTEGVLVIGTGVMLGLAGAVAMGQALRGIVFGVQPTDPRLLGAVAALTACVALLACIMPARRATRVNPVDVLSAQ